MLAAVRSCRLTMIDGISRDQIIDRAQISSIEQALGCLTHDGHVLLDRHVDTSHTGHGRNDIR
jgi:hypothetical protein